METLEPQGSASPDTEREFNLLPEHDYSGDWPRWKQAAIGSVAFHLVAITALFLIHGDTWQPPPPEEVFVPLVEPLYVPKELTQKAPNKQRLSKIMMAPSAPAPKIAEPQPKPAPPAPKQMQPLPTPVKPAPVVAPPQAAAPVEVSRAPAAAALPPPALPDKPKLEEPGVIVADSLRAQPSNTSRLPSTDSSISEALRNMGRGGAAPARNEVYDSGAESAASLRLPPSALRPQSSLNLKSDPMGVDFKPYLIQVLAAVRTNWFAVYPEAARLGARGQVVLEFSVTKVGGVPKVVFSSQTNSRPLNEAAVAAVSASTPLPPLPKEFKGDSIVLQMSFMYNMPR